jgi:cation:H+ antiporter
VLGDIGAFAIGIVFVTLGADWLVRGSSRLAANLGVSDLVVGLTVVAFGTSAPELVVSATAALNNQPNVAVGNVMGSTVANVGLIVGLGALMKPITVHRSLLVRETPLVIFVLTIVMLLSLNDRLGRIDGLALVSGFFLYLVFLLRWGGGGLDRIARAVEAEEAAETAATADEDVEAPGRRTTKRSPRQSTQPLDRRGTIRACVSVLVGLPLLLLGADWLIDAALRIAEAFAVPEAVIAATMIAIGTSLPELASTLAAALRGMGDIAIGNVIGSNVFNLGLVLGSAALLRPLELSPQIVISQVLPALVFSVVLIPLALTRERVGRWEGAALLVGYAGFIVWVL